MAEAARSDAGGRNTLVVFGGTGDLATRKLYPALASLAARDQLPLPFAVVAVARTEVDDAEFQERVYASVEKAGVEGVSKRCANAGSGSATSSARRTQPTPTARCAACSKRTTAGSAPVCSTWPRSPSS